MDYNKNNECCNGKDCHCLPGVHCDVTTCVHNSDACNCTADKISVRFDTGTDGHETLCGTYRKKD